MLLDRFFRWYSRVTGRHVALALGTVAVVVLANCVVLPVVAAAQLYFTLRPGEVAIFAATVMAVIVTGVSFVIVTDPQVRVVRAWRRGDIVDPVATWDAAVHVSWSAAGRGTALLAIVHAAISVSVLRHYAHLDGGEFVGSVVAAMLLTGVGGLLLALGMQLALRPAMDELLPQLPADLPPMARTPSMVRRFQAGCVAATLIGALASGAVVAHAHGRGARFESAVVASIAMALYATLVIHWTLLEPSLRPLESLTAATRRVRHGDFGEPVPVTTADELGDLARSFNDMQRGLAEREALHNAFGSYVDPVLAQRLLDQGSSVFDGEEVEVTVLFADVRNFTSYAERAEPADAVGLLNEIFDIAVPIIEEHAGHTNHYLGDGLLAVFGAPNALRHHADAAVRAALAMRERTAELNAAWEKSGRAEA